MQQFYVRCYQKQINAIQNRKFTANIMNSSSGTLVKIMELLSSKLENKKKNFVTDYILIPPIN